MLNNISFSVIIPAKNEESFIGQCIAGIQQQNFTLGKIEIIVVDNDSTDSTVSIANSLGATVIKQDEGNIGELRNLGARHAKGKMLAFLDADCIPTKNWLKNSTSHFTNHAVAAVGSKPQPPENSTWVESTWSIMKQTPRVGNTNWLSSCNFIVRSEVFLEIGGFDPTLETCEDADIGFRISKKWTMINDPAVEVIHLREPKTVKEFFMKEIWHGKDSYNGLKIHGLRLHEIPSLLGPPLMLVCTALFLASLIWSYTLLATLSLGLIFFYPLVLTTKVIVRNGFCSNISRIYFLFFIYSIARTFSLFKSK